jgi:hypothetical protein
LIAGYHSEAEEARQRGESLQTRQRKRRAGIGPIAVKVDRRFVYRDNASVDDLVAQEARIAASRDQGPSRRRPADRRHASAEAAR